jgi:hypothetical protein
MDSGNLIDVWPGSARKPFILMNPASSILLASQTLHKSASPAERELAENDQSILRPGTA